jgi:hypothetical protein
LKTFAWVALLSKILDLLSCITDNNSKDIACLIEVKVMNDKLRPGDIEILDKGIRTDVASLKYPQNHILMCNMRYDDEGEFIGDVLFVGSEDEVYRIDRKLDGFANIGHFAGEKLLLESLGLSSLR